MRITIIFLICIIVHLIPQICTESAPSEIFETDEIATNEIGEIDDEIFEGMFGGEEENKEEMIESDKEGNEAEFNDKTGELEKNNENNEEINKGESESRYENEEQIENESEQKYVKEAEEDNDSDKYIGQEDNEEQDDIFDTEEKEIKTSIEQMEKEEIEKEKEKEIDYTYNKKELEENEDIEESNGSEHLIYSTASIQTDFTTNVIPKQTDAPINGTKMPTDSPITNPTPTYQPNTEKPTEENESKEIKLIFRQLNNFNQTNKTTIEYDFYAIAIKENIKQGFEIILWVNLIHENGTRDEDAIDSTCILTNEIKENDDAIQAKFLCFINGLNEIYYSFRYNSSDCVSGVPNDEFALDPLLTKKKMEKGRIINANDTRVEIPPTFQIESIDDKNCKDSGLFNFKGTLSKKVKESIKFSLALTYPEGITLTCELKIEKTEIECKTDRKIVEKTIKIEQIIIKQGNKEVLILGSFESDKSITCLNELLTSSEKKSSVAVSFRQISHFKKHDKGFNFYLITLLSKGYKKGEKINVQMDVEINKNIEPKKATCLLEGDANSNSGELTQGNFNCSVDLSSSDISSLNDKNIKISAENEEISGVSDLDEITSNPYLTDQAIKDIKNKISNKKPISELEYVADYYEEKVKVIPTLNIDSIIDEQQCVEKGKFVLVGTFSEDIKEDIKFDLSLIYPLEELKCEFNGAKKNDKVNITCKVSKGFQGVEALVIEQKLITKKNKELFLVKNKKLVFNSPLGCKSYFAYKVESVKKRQGLEISFLRFNQYQLKPNALSFFMALTKKRW